MENKNPFNYYWRSTFFTKHLHLLWSRLTVMTENTREKGSHHFLFLQAIFRIFTNYIKGDILRTIDDIMYRCKYLGVGSVSPAIETKMNQPRKYFISIHHKMWLRESVSNCKKSSIICLLWVERWLFISWVSGLSSTKRGKSCQLSETRAPPKVYKCFTFHGAHKAQKNKTKSFGWCGVQVEFLHLRGSLLVKFCRWDAISRLRIVPFAKG